MSALIHRSRHSSELRENLSFATSRFRYGLEFHPSGVVSRRGPHHNPSLGTPATPELAHREERVGRKVRLLSF
jgi:hypothetical protein